MWLFSGQKAYTTRSLEYYNKALEIAKLNTLGEKNAQLENVQRAAKHLDSLYEKKGDIRTASLYNSIYYQYKDSIDKLKKDK